MGMSFSPPPGMMGVEKVPETKEEEAEGPKRVEFVLGRSQRHVYSIAAHLMRI